MARLAPKQLNAASPDLAGILPLLHRCFAFMEGRIDPPSSLARLTNERIQSFACEQEIWAIGSPPFACVFLTAKPDCLYLGKLAVDNDKRRQGLAIQLIKLAIERANDRGFESLEVEVRIELTENHGFFQRLGFIEVNRTAHAGFDRPTSITLRKPIP